MNGLNDFLRYIRFNLCLFSVFIAASGYLVHNSPSKQLIFVALTSFFLCAGAYSYNNITDQKEDVINRKRIAYFASHAGGKYISAAMFLSGFIFSLFLAPLSVLFAVITIATSLAYSGFRMKKYLFVKNLYTGFGVTQVFLIGASASSLTTEIFFYYILLSFFIIVESIISDLRDYDGDKASGIKTIPVCFGYEKSRHIVLLLLAIYSVSTFAFAKLLILTPFVFLMFFEIARDRPSLAHSLGSCSFMFLVPWLLI